MGISLLVLLCPVFSDQVLSDIPQMEDIIFNVRFTYLNILDVTYNF